MHAFQDSVVCMTVMGFGWVLIGVGVAYAVIRTALADSR